MIKDDVQKVELKEKQIDKVKTINYRRKIAYYS